MATPYPDATVFPFEPDGSFPVVEAWGYPTDVMRSRDDSEVRVPLRSTPTLAVRWTVHAVDEAETARLAALLWQHPENRWLVPRWPSARRVTDVAAGVYSVETANTDFVPFALALVWSRSDRWDLATVDIVAGGAVTLTIDGEPSFDHTAGRVYLVPLVSGSLDPSFDIARVAATGVFDARFECDMADYPAPAGGVAPSSYLAAELFDERGAVAETAERWTSAQERVGGDAGTFVVRPFALAPTVSRTFEWLTDSPAMLARLRAFLARRRGRAVPCWVPSQQCEFSLAAEAEAGADTLTVRRFDYGAHYPAESVRKYLVLPVGATFVAVEVTAWVATGPVNGVPAFAVTIDPVLAVDVPIRTPLVWLHFSRLSEDVVELEYDGGHCRAALSFTELPGETP